MPKVVTQRCLEQDLNLRPTDRKPKCLIDCTTAPARHLYVSFWAHVNLTSLKLKLKLHTAGAARVYVTGPIMVLELCDEPLKDWLSSRSSLNTDDLEALLGFALNIARGVQHLHSHKVSGTTVRLLQLTSLLSTFLPPAPCPCSPMVKPLGRHVQ